MDYVFDILIKIFFGLTQGLKGLFICSLLGGEKT